MLLVLEELLLLGLVLIEPEAEVSVELPETLELLLEAPERFEGELPASKLPLAEVEPLGAAEPDVLMEVLL